MPKKNKPKLTVAFVGNFTQEKGSRVFAKIVEACAKLNLPIQWWIIGGISDDASYYKAKESASINTTGFYTNDELADLLSKNSIDLGLLLSVFPESYSKLSRQCWRLNLPLIFSRIGILSSFTFSDLGIPTLADNHSLVVKKIQAICLDRTLLRKEQKKIRAAISSGEIISENNKHEQYAALYQKVK